MTVDLANHLWQSTAFAVAAAGLTTLLRGKRASVRFWVWMAASLKFLVPFAWLTGLGTRAPVNVLSDPGAAPALAAAAIVQFTEPFELPASTPSIWPFVLAALWISGLLAVLISWVRQWTRVRATSQLEPGVFGIFRPELRLPAGIENRLNPEQLRAVLAHEMAHIRRRDNLWSAIHMVVEGLFWFHPLVWWIGARLVEERERACDEEVLRQGADPQAYASGILEVCKLYFETRLAFVSGVTGADLKLRIENIVRPRAIASLTGLQKASLAAVSALALLAPVLTGVLRPTLGRAQTGGSLTFAVASVKRGDPDVHDSWIRLIPGGGIRITNVHLKEIVLTAYDLRDSQLSGAPSWMDSEPWSIDAKLDQPEGPTELTALTGDQARTAESRLRERLRSLLAERFHLTVRTEKKETTAFVLTQAKSGHKLKPSQPDDPGGQHLRAIRTAGNDNQPRERIEAKKVTMALLAKSLSRPLDRIVVDSTGLAGEFDFNLEWTPDRMQAGPPSVNANAEEEPVNTPTSLLTAIQEQLGLRLERRKAPVEMLVIERIERPTEN